MRHIIGCLVLVGIGFSVAGCVDEGPDIAQWCHFHPYRCPPPPPPPYWLRRPPLFPPPPPPGPAPAKAFVLFFDFDNTKLTPEAQSVVTEAVEVAKENGLARVVVTGHTDTVGTDSYNMGLSLRRAEKVKAEMIRLGMDGAGISIVGNSFHDPLVSTGRDVREPQNRRAVINLGN